MVTLMFVGLGITAILQLVVILVMGGAVRRIERVTREHDRHLFALNQLNRAQARQIGILRSELFPRTGQPIRDIARHPCTEHDIEYGPSGTITDREPESGEQPEKALDNRHPPF